MNEAGAPACASSSTARADETGISGWRAANQASKAEGSVSDTAIREGLMLPRPGPREKGQGLRAPRRVAGRGRACYRSRVAEDPFFPEAVPVPPDAQKRLRFLDKVELHQHVDGSIPAD